jgi:RNA polymerase sigma factor (sigma-70 family)
MTTPALQEQFQTLVEEHKKILYKICNSYCRERDARDDLAQEIIVQLWRSFEKFDSRCRFSTASEHGMSSRMNSIFSRLWTNPTVSPRRYASCTNSSAGWTL